MKAFVISIPGHQDSQTHADTCIQSVKDTNSELDIEKFTAIVPETMWQVDWKWPYTKKKVCPTTGMTLKAYKTYDMSKRIAAAGSHYKLWQKSVELNETIMILEHDAIFTRQFKPFKFEGGAISINNPDHATFNWKLYDKLDNSGEQEVPWVADKNIPQGLPGHSAYIIKPDAAEKICSLQDTIGWWPNDAIMCKQLCTWLRSYKPYFTKVQGIKSTTSK
jgi:GR25 family glycosyltransferase involved in LPS biosynthesis